MSESVPLPNTRLPAPSLYILESKPPVGTDKISSGEADVILTEPCTKASPTTSNFSLGVVVPIPTLDVASSTIKPEPLDPPTV